MREHSSAAQQALLHQWPTSQLGAAGEAWWLQSPSTRPHAVTRRRGFGHAQNASSAHTVTTDRPALPISRLGRFQPHDLHRPVRPPRARAAKAEVSRASAEVDLSQSPGSSLTRCKALILQVASQCYTSLPHSFSPSLWPSLKPSTPWPCRRGTLRAGCSTRRRSLLVHRCHHACSACHPG